MIDQTIRRLRYNFFKLSKGQRFFLLVRYALIKDEDIELIPLSFFERIFNRMLVEGGMDRLSNDPLMKDKE